MHLENFRRRSCRWLVAFFVFGFAAWLGLRLIKAEEFAAAQTKTREPIYNPDADAKADIARALARAKRNNQRVLVTFGGNWCPWCYKLHEVFKTNDDIAPVINTEYVQVLVDVQNNQQVLTGYGKDNDKHGVPFLTVLDGDGNVVANQDTGDFGQGSTHDPERVLAFLTKWKVEPADAQARLDEALAKAKAENKKVLAHLGAPWCGWCGVLERFLGEHASVLEQDYVDLKIDVDRMASGKKIGEELRKERSGGIPWMVILGADGEELISADGPEGNIGYPVDAPEIAHFMRMLRETSSKITAEQLAAIEADLNAYRAERERKRAAKSQ